ncbi:hypothetical protein [Methanolobus psychrotolerans]|uniref:hypothetical protein n=1 Tax=Methanolobus psychrotolerans TaxID=1874706 RepID=UPI000B916AF0|nr:hypothetical protein [Methanolobus psychrotolerans]
MLEIYCDASYRAFASFIGCVVLKDGEMILQLTKKIIPKPCSCYVSEIEAINFASQMFTVLAENKEQGIIYNDNASAVKCMQRNRNNQISITHVSRSEEFQKVADRLARGFDVESTCYCREKDDTNNERNKEILDFYGGSKQNENGEFYFSYVVCHYRSILCQCTMRSFYDPGNHVLRNIELIRFSKKLSKLFPKSANRIIVHNISKEAIAKVCFPKAEKHYLQHSPDMIDHSLTRVRWIDSPNAVIRIVNLHKQKVEDYSNDV